MFRYLRNPKNRSVVLLAASAGVASSVVVASVALRLRREELLATLPNACAGPGACGGAGAGAGAGGAGAGAGAGVGGGGCDGSLSRSPGSLVELVERLALMVRPIAPYTHSLTHSLTHHLSNTSHHRTHLLFDSVTFSPYLLLHAELT
jgi:hypothetical protein